MEPSSNRIASVIGGVALIAFGLLALLVQIFGGFNFWDTFWPFIVIGVGVLFFVGMAAGGKSTSGLAIPGAIVTGIGLMLFAQNLTGHWESWAYGWTFILMFVGAGIYIMGVWSGEASQKKSGLRLIQIGLILFLIFGTLFEGLIFRSFKWSEYVFPIVLILAGLYLVIRRAGILSAKAEDQSDNPPTTTN